LALIDVLADRLQPLADRLADQSMVKETSYSIARRLASKILITCVATPIIAISGIIVLLLVPGFGNPLGGLFVVAAAAPALPAAVEYMKYKTAIDNRKRRTDIEYPFFTTFSAIIARCGGTLYTAFNLAKKVKDIFPQTSKEAEEVERKAVLARMGVMRAMEGHAQGHPHRGFSTAILTTTSVWRSGGDVIATLESLSEEALNYLSRKLRKFAEDMATFSEVMFIALILLPMGVAISAIADPNTAMSIGFIMAGVVAPILGFVSYIVIDSMSPRINNFFEVKTEKLLLTLLIGLFIVLTSLLMSSFIGVSIPLPIVLSVSITAASTALYLSIRDQVREIEDTEMELRRYLRTVVEYRKLGIVMSDALRRASSQRYRPGFMKLIKSVSSRIAMGLGIYKAAAIAKSWIARMVFWLLEVIDRFGGASPQLLEKVLELLTRYSEARDEVRSRTRIFIYLNYAAPFLLSFTLAFTLPILKTGVYLGPAVAASPPSMSGMPGAATPFPQASAPIEPIMNSAFLMMLVPSVLLAFSMSKGLELHPWKLVSVAITAALYIPAYYLTLMLMPMTESFLLGGFQSWPR